jgi:hypothetical protein
MSFALAQALSHQLGRRRTLRPSTRRIHFAMDMALMRWLFILIAREFLIAPPAYIVQADAK